MPRGAALALLLSLATQAQASSPRVALWAEPLYPVVANVADLGISVRLGLPVGVSFPLGPVDFMATGWVYSSALDEGDVKTFELGAWLALGPVIHTGAERLGGFFVSPRVTAGYFKMSYKVGPDIPVFLFTKGERFELLVGADFGWQHTFGSLYLGFVVGASVGFGTNRTLGVWSPPVFPFGFNRNPKDDLIVSLNFSLVRIGVAFAR